MSGKLKEVRLRIQSVKSTQQITKAMKMVSAAKFKKAQDNITQMRPYAEKLQDVLSNIVETVEGDIYLPLAEERPIVNVLQVVITSDRGLCGAFNTNIIKAALRNIEENYKEQDAARKVTILPLGKKALDYFTKRGDKVDDKFWNIFSDLNYDQTIEIAEYITEQFREKQYDKVDIIYSRFVNAAVQDFSVEAYLPIPRIANEDETQKSDFIFEPEKTELINNMMPKILNTQMYKALLDNNASEHGARMTAMDKATENAGELLRELKIMFNQARQAAITTELTEIVSGAAALEG